MGARRHQLTPRRDHGRQVARGGIPGALWRYNNHSAYVRGVTLLARRMERDPRAFLGYYHWQVYYGDTLLPEGYPQRPASRSG